MTGSATTAVAGTGSGRHGFWKRNQRTLAPWIFLAPGIAMFSLYVIYPINRLDVAQFL